MNADGPCPGGSPGGPPRGQGSQGPGDLWRYGSIGIEFAAAIVLCVLLGWWLDNRWHTAPWLTLAGLALGFSAGLYRMIRMLNAGR